MFSHQQIMATYIHISDYVCADKRGLSDLYYNVLTVAKFETFNHRNCFDYVYVYAHSSSTWQFSHIPPSLQPVHQHEVINYYQGKTCY